MSNKIKKNNSTTEINKDEPKILQLLRGRLKTISEHDKKKEQFKSSIIYLFIEIFLFSFYYVYMRKDLPETYMYAILIFSNVLISVYNIVISLFHILKHKFRKVGNIVLIVLHSLFILLSVYTLF
jgi:hypothetical protein